MLTFYDDDLHGDNRYVVLAAKESHTLMVMEQKRAPAVVGQSAAVVAEVQIYPEEVEQNTLVEVSQNALVEVDRNALVAGI